MREAANAAAYAVSLISPAADEPFVRAPQYEAIAAQAAPRDSFAGSDANPNVVLDSFRIVGEGVIDGCIVGHFIGLTDDA
jgi:hypothetical protein